MTTITRLKQLRDQLAGKLTPQRVERKRQEQLLEQVQAMKGFDRLSIKFEAFDRFASYRQKIVPSLRESGYGYFLSCDSADYQEHQEWCNDNCEDHSLPFCDVWQVDCKYPRAFASKAHATLFCLTFDALQIEVTTEI